MAAALGRRQAIPLAVGSVAGSGILFLPSAVYAEAGRASLLVWLTATLLCLPMLLMFEDMVRASADGDGIEAFVRAGLGEVVGRCIPVLFVALVIVGLPAGALVAGRYVADALGTDDATAVATAAAVLVVAIAVNVAGTRVGSVVQRVGTWALVAMAVTLVVAAAPDVTGAGAVLSPRPADLAAVPPGVMLAFWAFAGFENLTFLSRDLRDPRRDFLPISAVALGVYGVLTILLTVAIAVRVPVGAVDEVTGLLQLALTTQPRGLVVGAVTVIALCAMALNAVAWVWGMSRMMAGAAHRGILPSWLRQPAGATVPTGALVTLGGLFALTGTVLARHPAIVVDAVATASAIFVVLYLLCIVSYVRVRGLTRRSSANLALLVVLGLSLVQSGWRSLYAAVVLAVALTVTAIRSRRATYPDSPGAPVR